MNVRTHVNPMQGHIEHSGRLLSAGFMRGQAEVAHAVSSGIVAGQTGHVPVSRAELAEALNVSEKKLAEVSDKDIKRVEFTGQLSDLTNQLNTTLEGVRRALTSSDIPVRENLEAPATQLIPADTPFRNMLPRTRGNGVSTKWKQLTSLGGGWGSSADVLQPGGGSAKRTFYDESGAPEEFDETYVDKYADYKLLGAFGKITNFALASGENYQDQMARKRVNTMTNLMLNEEYALIAGDADSTSAPWGDGSNKLAFNGVYNLVTTANGTPTQNVQTSVGALTKAHIDGQLTNIWRYGGSNLYMLLAAQEIQSLVALAEQDGSIIRVEAASAGDVILGMKVTGYVHPISGEVVQIIPSRFASNGTMLFGAKNGPVDASADTNDTLVVDVLPQVPTPPSSPENPQEIQGYVFTQLARETTSPDVVPFMVSVYEVLKMRNATVFAKSTGVTSVDDGSGSGSGSG